MGCISIARARSVASISPELASDAKLGMLLAVSNAIFYSLTRKDLGNCVESISQAGDDVQVTVYGHLQSDAGKVYFSGCGASLNGEKDFEYLDDNTLLIKNVTLSGQTTLGRMYVRRVFDAPVIGNCIEVSPSPIYQLVEVKILRTLGEQIDNSEVLDLASIDIPKTNDQQFNSTILVNTPIVSSYERSRFFLNAQPSNRQKMARVTYYSGLDRGVPMDLVQAISAASKEIIAADGMPGVFQSENIDFYSYSRASMNEIKDYPMSALATFMRYR